MGWELLDRPKTMLVTKKLATQFAEMTPAPRDRPLSERRLAIYERLLTQGMFRPVTWATALCRETGETYRVNGKHTSVLLSGQQKIPEFYVTVESYQCESLEDVAKLYATFDSGLQSRTARDIYLSFAATVPELQNLPGRTIAVAVSGLAIGLGETSSLSEAGWSAREQPAERAEYLLDHPEFVLWLHDILGAGAEHKGKDGTSSARHLSRAPVVGAMFGNYRKAKGQATEFWTAVRDETGTSPTLPDRKLARYLLTVGVNSGAGAQRVRRASVREIYVKCLHSWNAWRKGEATDLKYFAEARIPAIV